MALNLASPGIVVREVDLTLGRVDPVSDKVAALAAPFAQGPVEVPTLIQNESDLLANFGKSYDADRHYENWMVASSYLAYGGSLRVIRVDDADMKNSFFGSGTAPKIKSLDQYTDSNIRDSRDDKNNLNYLSDDFKLKEIENCEVVNLKDDKCELIKLKDL